MSLVLETALDAVVVMDAAGDIVDWNRPAESIFGWTHDEAVGQSLAELIVPPSLREAHNRGLAHYLETGEGPVLNTRIEVSALRKGGAEFPVELSIAPLASEPKRFLGFVRDVSARRKYEADLERKARHALLLHNVTALAGTSRSADEVLRACLEAVCELTGWTIGHAFLREGDEFVSTDIWVTTVAADISALREITEATRFSGDIGIPGRILQTGAPVWITDVYADPEFVRTRTSVELGIRSAFGFAIRNGDDVIAVLEFFSGAPLQPEDDLILVSRALGDQFGRVWERLRTADLLRDEKRKLEAEVAERRRAQEQQAHLLEELNHRVKNILSVVIGIAKQTAARSASIPDFTTAFVGRISALARSHGLLTAHSWKATPFEDLVREILAPYIDAGSDDIALSGGAITLPPKAAVSAGMVLHELATNAAKYGALAEPGGRLAVSWTCDAIGDGAVVRLSWAESGVDLSAQIPGQGGFGTKLIEMSVRHELRGGVERTIGPDGYRYDIEFPLERETHDAG